MERLPNRMRALAALLAFVGPFASPALADFDLSDRTRLRIGIGDRLSLDAGDEWVSTLDLSERLGLRLDLAQIWLPRGWKESWLDLAELARLKDRGVTPVVVHYFFGDDISKERVEDQRKEWYESLWRMARRIRDIGPVLVVLEPEFNVAPPAGETAITDWPWFANDLRAAAKMIRREAPNALVGVCPGDFPGTPNLEPVLGPVAADLDFLAFQEMRAATRVEGDLQQYIGVGKAATDYAQYLKRAFDRPILLGYVAVSSYDGWEEPQRAALQDLLDHRQKLLEAGVFGLVYFQLRDDPRHRGYFGEAEKHFGLTTGDGEPKPSLEVFRALSR